jgi:hypothetical protein
MATKRNLMVKVLDARPADVKKILKDSGIEVISIVEIHKEDIEQGEQKPAEEK